MMTRAFVAVLIALLGGWLWTTRGSSDLDQALRASELRDDLREAHISLLGACADLSALDFRSASRQLEEARGLLRRAEERGTRLGWRDEVSRIDLARFEADIDEAQRLLARLDQGATSVVPQGPLTSLMASAKSRPAGAGARPVTASGPGSTR